MTKQWTAKPHRPALQLIPPLAEEFTLYGGPDTVERAREWALDGHYLLADGIPNCAHGLYLMAMCPHGGACASNFRQLDHARIWVPTRETPRPFLLSHPYAAKIDGETRMYAQAHGLNVTDGEFLDGWYGRGTIPIMMTVPENWPVWPIEEEIAALLSTQPVAWPSDDDPLSWS